MAVMARLLDPRDFGLVAMVTVVTGIYEMFLTAGLSSATIQRNVITNEQLSTLFWINILVGVLLCCLCLVSAPILVAVYHEPSVFWVTMAMAAGFLFNSAGVQHFALLHRRLRYVALTIIETVTQLSSYALGIGLAIAGYGYWALVAGPIGASAVMTACAWAVTAWIPGRPRRDSDVRSMLRFGGTITLNGLVVYVAYNFDKFLLGRFWGADVLGIYGRAFHLVNIPTASLNAAVGGVAFSALSRLQDDPARLKAYFLKGYSLVISLTAPTTIFCAILAEDIVLVVLGPKWTDAALIFRLLSPTVLIFGIINPTGWLLWSIGRQGRSLAIAFAIAPLVMVSCLVGLPYGANGVAFAYSAAMTLWLVPHIIWSLHKTVVSPRELLAATYRPIIASVMAAIIVLGVMPYLGRFHLPALRLALEGGAMAGLYLLILLFVMGQRTFYADLLRCLKSLPRSA
jgi:PST family polysaccharide transporter